MWPQDVCDKIRTYDKLESTVVPEEERQDFPKAGNENKRPSNDF